MKNILRIAMLILLTSIPVFGQDQKVENYLRELFPPSGLSPRYKIPLVVNYGGHVQILPHFALGGGWEMEINVENKGATSSLVTLYFFKTDGVPFSVNTNIGNGTSITLTLPPGGSRLITLAPTIALNSGYVAVDQKATAEELSPSVESGEVFKWSQTGKTVTAVGVQAVTPAKNFTIPVKMNTKTGAGLALAFPKIFEGQPSSTTVILSLIREDGTIERVAKFPLLLGGQEARFLNDLFSGLTNFSGNLSVSSPDLIAVLALRTDDSVYSSVSSSTGPSVGSFVVGGTPIPEVEPNGSVSEGQVLSLPAIVSASINPLGERDMFLMDLVAGEIVTVLTTSDTYPYGIDTVVSVVKTDGSIFVGFNDESGIKNSHDSFLQFVVPLNGRYSIEVYDYWGTDGNGGNYLLHVSKR